MYRYNNRQWTKLETKVVGTTAAYAFYESKTPRFSYFAIAYDPTKVTPIRNETELIPVNDTAPQTKITGETIIEEPKDDKKQKGSLKGIILFISGILMTAGIVIGVIFIGKYNRQIKTLEALISKERQEKKKTQSRNTPLKLLNYIERQLHKNTPEKKIWKFLKKEGWSDEDIGNGFEEARN
jgi:hypothetical protein